MKVKGLNLLMSVPLIFKKFLGNQDYYFESKLLVLRTKFSLSIQRQVANYKVCMRLWPENKSLGQGLNDLIINSAKFSR